MTLKHHATEETLMRYASGFLAAGPAIVVQAHLSQCAACRSRVATYEALGGAVLETMEPAALAHTSLAETLARIDEADAESPTQPEATSKYPEIAGVRLPDSLAGCEIGRWRWIGPGMHMSRVGTSRDPNANIILLKVGPGRALPDHGHVGTEFTYIISGSFTDKFGQFRAGDLAEMDDDVEHQPIVDADSECICLAAMEGKMRFNSAIGRLLQPLFGI